MFSKFAKNCLEPTCDLFMAEPTLRPKGAEHFGQHTRLTKTALRVSRPFHPKKRPFPTLGGPATCRVCPATCECSASSARGSRARRSAPSPTAGMASSAVRNEDAAPQLGADLKGASFETLKATCAELNIQLQPNIDEGLASIKRQKAKRDRERQLEHALRMRVVRAIEAARAAPQPDLVRANAHSNPALLHCPASKGGAGEPASAECRCVSLLPLARAGG